MWFVQAVVKSLEKRASEAEEKFAQARRESEERLKRAEQAEAKISETQEALQRYVLQSNAGLGLDLAGGPRCLCDGVHGGGALAVV